VSAKKTGPIVAAALLLGSMSAPALAIPAWKERVDRLIRGKAIGVSVRIDGERLYEHKAKVRRTPASNQKLLLTMALFERFGPRMQLSTRASVSRLKGDTVRGNLYLFGGGDPAVTGGGSYGRSLPFKPTGLRRVARRIKAVGITRIRGRVVGGINYFAHDWYAPGWKTYFPRDYIALPSALTFEGNTHKGVNITNPEYRAARALTAKLKSVGVRVNRSPRSSTVRRRTIDVASVSSKPLSTLVRFMNRHSSNFFAELLGKRLGVERRGAPGTIAKAAAAIRSWAGSLGVTIKAFDASGLSYANRISARGLARLLDWGDEQSWWGMLRTSLPTGSQGTLEGRLRGVRVRAKTGTLETISALSGWIYLKREKTWAPFSILSSGMPKYRAASIEDKIVRILEKRAACGSGECGKGAALTTDSNAAVVVGRRNGYLAAALVAELARAALTRLLFP
jgi:serine-type D-Ala-D-Ala carboxypeptidase/endopeptidase (penicillin-binding protein 4)